MTKQIPIRYVGPKDSDSDHLYGSKVVFTKGKIALVPDWAAARLLQHPEFEDARPKGERGKPINAVRVPDPAELEQERMDLEQIEAHVNIEPMTRDQMAAYAMRTYGVRVDATMAKAEVTSAVRNVMALRGTGAR